MSKKDKKNKNQEEEVELLSRDTDEEAYTYPGTLYVRADDLGGGDVNKYFEASAKAVELIGFGDTDEPIEVAEYKLVKTKRVKLQKTLVEVANG